jgi:ribosomal subunit interface protein
MESGEDMDIVVKIRIGRISDGLRACIRRRLEFSLARFADRLAHVSVRVSDREPTPDGRLYVCRVEAEIRPSGGALMEEVTDHNLHGAIDLAADRLGRALHRTLVWNGDAAGAHGGRRGQTEGVRPTVAGLTAADAQAVGHAIQGGGK